jgi:gas vesicle protein
MVTVAPQSTNPNPITQATAVVDLGLRACEAYGRDDLVGRLTAAKRSLADPSVHIVVVGEFKQGKSSLVNALVGANVCPVDDDVATAVPTYLRHGDEPGAELIFEGDPPRREPVELTDVRRWIVEDDPTSLTTGVAGAPGRAAEERPRPAGVEVRLPRRLLAGGLVLVDTPGVGGLGSAHSTASLAASSMADALLFVTDASQELTRSELDFLAHARQMCPTVVCVLTKTDFYPAWRKVRDLNQSHLAAAGADIPIIPVSSTLRSRAVAANDTDLNNESGFPELVTFIRDRVSGHAAARLAAEATAGVVAVAEQIISQFESERAALADPAAAQQVVAQLTRVKEQVEALKSAAARWSQTLSDGIADLTSDVEHDLRHRIREVIAEADRAIEDIDPADTWPEMQSWLESTVANEMLANYTLLRDRATTLSEQVGQHFQEASGEVLRQFPVFNPTPLASSVEVDHNIELEKMKVGKQAMVALKAAYGGAIMFVMIGLMTGITLGPIALGIGVIMGRKGLRDEKKKQVAARQQQAKNAVRRYCDQVSFVMGKDSRDTLRRIQRELRDHYTALAEELNRSNAEALRSATEATKSTQAERDKRIKDIEAELNRLRQLKQRAEAVTAG